MTLVELTSYDGDRVAVSPSKVVSLCFDRSSGYTRIGLHADAAVFVKESFDHVAKVLEVDLVPGFEEQTDLRGDVSL